jgi:hypothetical protein
MRRLTIFLVMMLLPVACGGGIDSGDLSTTSTSTSSGTSTTVALAPIETTTTTMSASTTTTLEMTTTTMANPNSVAETAIGMLAAHLSVTPNQITVVKAESVTWSDGSLGCPEPDTSYTQMLVEGTQVVVQYQDRLYDYHAGPDGVPFLCKSTEKDGGYEFVPPPGFDQ